MKKFLIAVVCLCFMLFLCGCNVYATADSAYHVIDAALGVALAELPTLPATGIISQNEEHSLVSVLGAVHSLNDTYGSCIETVHASGNKKSAFASCVNSFATSLASPQLLASLRVVNPKGQQKVQVWIIAVTTGLNIAVAATGGTPVQAPVVSAGMPSQQQLDAFSAQVVERMEATN